MNVRMPALVLTVVVAMLVAVPSAAAPRPTINPTPDTVRRGQPVTISGVIVNCASPVTLISRAFGRRHTYGGIGAVSARINSRGRYSVRTYIPATRPAKVYVISGRCGGAQLGVTANLKVTS